MKVLVISQYFYPENFRVNDLVVGLSERGHAVTVLTGQPNYPFGKFFEGHSWHSPKIQDYAGARVIRCPLFPRGGGGNLRLILNYLSFCISACWAVIFRLPKSKSFDTIFVFEPSPITVGIPAILARWRYRIPLLFWVLDLWPESLEAVGAIRQPWLINLVGKMVRWIYRRCDLILVQSKSFMPKIAYYGIKENLIRYFPNWGEPEYNEEKPRAVSDILAHLPSALRIMFAGNIGVAQDFPAIIEAATILKDRTDICWLIIGDGRMADWVKEQVIDRGLQRTVHLLGQHPPEKMPAFFAEADALLVSLKRDPIFALTVPGKLQSYLASGKPVLAMIDGESAFILSEADAGIHCDAGNAQQLADAVKEFAGLSVERRNQMGQNGRRYFELNFSRERVFDNLESWLIELAEHD